MNTVFGLVAGIAIGMTAGVIASCIAAISAWYPGLLGNLLPGWVRRLLGKENG